MSNRNALVTGGSRGIGRAIVVELARTGWNVVFSYRSDAASADETMNLASPYGRIIHAVQADTADRSGRAYLIEEAQEKLSGIDLLVNNAGMAPRQRVDLLEISPESFAEVMQNNLSGPFFLTQQVAAWMVHQGRGGKIINIGSISAYTSSIQRGEYCLSKAGLAMMTTLFADRLAGEGILVYEIRPGIIATDMTAGVKEKYDRLIAEGLLPLRRWGTPEDVARAVIAIAEGCLPYSTGEIINVDGGFHFRRLQ